MLFEIVCWKFSLLCLHPDERTKPDGGLNFRNLSTGVNFCYEPVIVPILSNEPEVRGLRATAQKIIKVREFVVCRYRFQPFLIVTCRARRTNHWCHDRMETHCHALRKFWRTPIHVRAARKLFFVKQATVGDRNESPIENL